MTPYYPVFLSHGLCQNYCIYCPYPSIRRFLIIMSSSQTSSAANLIPSGCSSISRTAASEFTNPFDISSPSTSITLDTIDLQEYSNPMTISFGGRSDLVSNTNLDNDERKSTLNTDSNYVLHKSIQLS